MSDVSILESGYLAVMLKLAQGGLIAGGLTDGEVTLATTKPLAGPRRQLIWCVLSLNVMHRVLSRWMECAVPGTE